MVVILQVLEEFQRQLSLNQQMQSALCKEMEERDLERSVTEL